MNVPTQNQTYPRQFSHILHIIIEGEGSPQMIPASAPLFSQILPTPTIHEEIVKLMTIHEEIFNLINEKEIINQINGMDVKIKWMWDDANAYYYTDVKGMLGDVAVKEHTILLFSHIQKVLNDKNICMSDISYRISRPLVKQIPLW